MRKINKPKKYSPEYIGMYCNIKGLKIFRMSPDDFLRFGRCSFLIINVSIATKHFFIQPLRDRELVLAVKKDLIEIV